MDILRAKYQQRGTLHVFGLACDDEHHLEDSDLPQHVQHWQQLYYNTIRYVMQLTLRAQAARVQLLCEKGSYRR